MPTKPERNADFYPKSKGLYIFIKSAKLKIARWQNI